MSWLLAFAIWAYGWFGGGIHQVARDGGASNLNAFAQSILWPFTLVVLVLDRLSRYLPYPVKLWIAKRLFPSRFKKPTP